MGDYLLIAIDGTQAIKSNKINCKSCNTRVHKSSGSTDFYHYALGCAIVSPPEKGLSPLILPSEVLTPQDGHDKQDCERAAIPRLLDRVSGFTSNLGPKIIFLGDDIYSCEPICEHILNLNQNFIFTCKEDSHKHLISYIDEKYMETVIITYRRDGNTIIEEKYQYQLNLPIKADKKCCKKISYVADVQHVNYIKLTITIRDKNKNIILDDKGNQKISYFAYITNLMPDKDNIVELIAAGRSRWEIENRVFNNIKNHGYNFEHNYGHGKNGLAALVIMLIMLSFLLHTSLRLLFPELEQIIKANSLSLDVFQQIFSTLKIIRSEGLIEMLAAIGLVRVDLRKLAALLNPG
jgi:hypothetical protein